jgi:hypothetical protein
MKAKLIIPILILILLSTSVLSAVADDTAIMNQINERLERNKAEIIKAVRDANNQSQNSTQKFIDSNFEVLDGRIQEFLKGSKRDIGAIMIATFLVGFCLSQIIRIGIERSRRHGLINRAMELEVAVEKLTKEAGDLTAKVRQLKVMDETYSKELKSLTKKPPFITIQAVLLAIITFCVGVGVAILLLKVNVGG